MCRRNMLQILCCVLKKIISNISIAVLRRGRKLSVLLMKRIRHESSNVPLITVTWDTWLQSHWSVEVRAAFLFFKSCFSSDVHCSLFSAAG